MDNPRLGQWIPLQELLVLVPVPASPLTTPVQLFEDKSFRKLVKAPNTIRVSADAIVVEVPLQLGLERRPDVPNGTLLNRL